MGHYRDNGLRTKSIEELAIENEIWYNDGLSKAYDHARRVIAEAIEKAEKSDSSLVTALDKCDEKLRNVSEKAEKNKEEHRKNKENLKNE